MTTQGVPKRISTRWLEGRRGVLRITAKILSDGTPNPAHAAMAEEVAEAEGELERWQALEAWVGSALGLTLNAYPLRTKGATYEPGQVFLRKESATGQVTFLTRQAAWDKYLSAQQGV